MLLIGEGRCIAEYEMHHEHFPAHTRAINGGNHDFLFIPQTADKGRVTGSTIAAFGCQVILVILPECEVYSTIELPVT